MKRINNTINKRFILENVNQIRIFSRYFRISEDDIDDCIEGGGLMSSPVRTEDNPSTGFRYNAKGILKMRDFGGFFWGDCFDAVAYVLSAKGRSINIAKAEDFKHVLNSIAIEFDIIDGVKETSIDLLVNRVKHTKKIIEFEPRSWNTYDKRFWIHSLDNLFDTAYLAKHHVYPVERYWINSYSQPEPKYYYTSKDPCYAYYLGNDKNKIANVRLYFPKRTKKDMKPRFISNNNVFQGLMNLDDKYDKIVLIKSYKDTLALRRMMELFSFTGNYSVLTIGYPSENYLLNDVAIEWLFSKLHDPYIGNILNFTDFDRAGRKAAKYGNDTYGIPYVFLTNGEFGLPNHNAKDLTDFIEKYGVKDTYTIIETFIKTNIYEQNEDVEDTAIW